MRIEDYALIGDMQTAALVGRDGSIDWLCLPRFDSAACFAALLDEPRAGRWLLAPADGTARCERRYRPDTLVLESTWQADGGCVRVLDFMPPRGEAPDVVRIVEGVHGRVEMRTELALRFDYGRVVPWTRYDGGELAAVAGPDSAWLDAPVPLDSHAGTATSGFAVAAGDRLPFVLTWQQSWLPRPARVDAFIALDDTESAWTGWLRDCAYRGDRYGEAVRRSLLTLKALTY
ncbi:glycoside hydrolase family 15 protein, partial [Nonomuraea sp. NPDC004297]